MLSNFFFINYTNLLAPLITVLYRPAGEYSLALEHNQLASLKNLITLMAIMVIKLIVMAKIEWRSNGCTRFGRRCAAPQCLARAVRKGRGALLGPVCSANFEILHWRIRIGFAEASARSRYNALRVIACERLLVESNLKDRIWFVMHEVER